MRHPQTKSTPHRFPFPSATTNSGEVQVGGDFVDGVTQTKVSDFILWTLNKSDFTLDHLRPEEVNNVYFFIFIHFSSVRVVFNNLFVHLILAFVFVVFRKVTVI